VPSAARLANAEEMRKKLGLVPAYEKVAGIEAVKVAVLDYGFEGLDGVRPYLPQNAALVEHYDPDFVRRFKLGDPDYRKSFAPGNSHGRLMAQIVWGMTGFHPRGPKFYLLNANGPTMLRRAVRYAIEEKVDIILFSGTFEGGGNGDGRGPINRIVADAIATGIIWINAAGNYGGHVYNSPVEVLRSSHLRLSSGPDSTALRFRNLLDENTITVTLTWNDYQEQEDAGTDKDLDLYVEDWQGRQVGASELTQVSKDKQPGENESRNPRERVVLPELAAARDREYRIRIRAKSANFTRNDRIRVLVTSSRDAFFDSKTNAPADAVQFLDATEGGEIYPPADHPLVITVGDATTRSATGPTADHRVKPDVVLEDSQAVYTNGEVSGGASNAAAYFAGVVAVLKTAEPDLRTRHLLRLARQNGTSPPPSTSQKVVVDPSLGQEISLRQAREWHHPEIIDRLQQAVGGQPVRAFLNPNNRLVLGIPMAPADLRTVFRRFPTTLRNQAANYEFYLSLRYESAARPTGVALYDEYRRKTAQAGRPDPYPWEIANRLNRNSRRTTQYDFIEVRQLPPNIVTTAPQPVLPRRLWHTPTRERLAEVVRAERVRI
jgi:hypothetical protein